LGHDIQTAIRAELEMMLSAPAFAQSNRCKRFLNYVVTQTLSGHAGELKERMIGISVFDRPNDYDTGGDSIVRVTSNEVRKRIGQFYRESQTAHPIQIELPRGSYVPEFRICATPRSSGATEVSERETGVDEVSLVSETRSATVKKSDGTVSGKNLVVTTGVARTGHSHRFKAVLALPIVFLVSAGVVMGVWRERAKPQFPHLWDAFQSSKVPVLICLGAHDIPIPKEALSSNPESFRSLVLHRETIPVDDVTVIASMASSLGKQGIPFRVTAADQVSLTDLRRQPVILIGAADNLWTQRLTQDLRYRIEVMPAGSTTPRIASIVDSKQPANASWAIDYSIPMTSWKSDYAIVARMNDSITGVSVLIDAGLGNDGSIAASELISSGSLATSLAAEPSCNGKSNFEAVVETNIIDTRPGPPHILRLTCW
jgi:hypothetical protein